MGRTLMTSLGYVALLCAQCLILTGCSGKSLILSISDNRKDSVDHYSVCAQVNNLKADSFRVSPSISKIRMFNQLEIPDFAEARLSVRAIDVNGLVIGSGYSSTHWTANALVEQIDVTIDYFQEPYRCSSQTGFCADPQYEQRDIAWRGVWLSESGDEGWAVGADVVYAPERPLRPRLSHYTHGRWELVPDEMLPSGLAAQNIFINAVWGSDQTHVWAVGDRGTILYWDGVRWNDISRKNTCTYSNDLYGVWGTKQTIGVRGTADVCKPWVVGNNGTVSCLDGSLWDCSRKVELTSNRIAVLRKLGGSSPSDVWLVGGYVYCLEKNCPAYQLLMKYEGGKFVEVNRDGIEHPGYLTNISGVGAEHVWSVTDTAEILEWNGKEWTARQPKTRDNSIDFGALDKDMNYVNGFNAVWMGAQNDVWIAMYSGKVLNWHMNSAGIESWNVSATPSPLALLALSGSDSCNMLLAGHADYRAVYLPDELPDDP